MRDESFVRELDGKVAYFRALKCLNISYSHALLGGHLNALALIKRGQDLTSANPLPQASEVDANAPPSLALPVSLSNALGQQVDTLLSRSHALVELRKLSDNSVIAAKKNLVSAAPVVQNLNAYPSPGTQVDLKNLVAYPPRIQPVPVKPLFLDMAWNYIEYPGRLVQDGAAINGMAGDKMEVDEKAKAKEPAQEKKRGWFGFDDRDSMSTVYVVCMDDMAGVSLS